MDVKTTGIPTNASPAMRPQQDRLSSLQQHPSNAISMPSSSKNQLIKPRAVKATTIHPSILQEFQRTCRQELELSSQQEEAAIRQSQHWHQKWTLQDEEAHQEDGWQIGSGSGDASLLAQSRGIPIGGQVDLLMDRKEGAMNPPLSSSEGSSQVQQEGEEINSSWSSSASSESRASQAWRRRQQRRAATETPRLHPIAPPGALPPDISPLQLPRATVVSPVRKPSSPRRRRRRSKTLRPAMISSEVSDSETEGDEEASPSPLTIPSSSSSVSSSFRLDRKATTTTEAGYLSSSSSIGSFVSLPSTVVPTPCVNIEAAKERLLSSLASAGGDVTCRKFQKTLLPLWKHYKELGWDARGRHLENDNNNLHVEGMWFTLSKPTFFGNLGETDDGDPMYTLGRMAFDMFLPTQLIVSLQGNFNPVHVVPEKDHQATLDKIPKSLLEDFEMGRNNVLRTYNIVSAFTIESSPAAFPNAPNKNVRRPIKGIMTTFGYVLPDPQVPNRLSIWFTGGQIRPNNDVNDQREWKRLFAHSQTGSRTMGEKVRCLAANLLMGAQVPTEMKEDGTMEYTFTRPLGGHGVAYMDVIYLDSSLRVCRGHRGTLFVFARIPDHGETVE